jgi:uncharacterized membrane protein
MVKLRQYFLAGLISLAPLVITCWVLWQIYRLVNSFTRPWLVRITALQEVPGFLLTLSGLTAFLILILLAGVLVQNVFGVALFRFVERSMRRLPLARIVFDTTKQIGEVLLNPQRNAFQQVALIEYPRRDCFVIGFVTADDGVQDLIAVFVSTPPNPATGLCLMVPRRDVVVLPLTIEDGLRLVVSGGALLSASQARILAEGSTRLLAAQGRTLSVPAADV